MLRPSVPGQLVIRRRSDDSSLLSGNLRFPEEEVENGYFEQLIRDYLLDNPFEAVIVVAPEKNLTAKEDEKLAKKLADYKASLSEEQLEELVAATGELKEYQDTPSTPEILGKDPALKTGRHR